MKARKYFKLYLTTQLNSQTITPSRGIKLTSQTPSKFPLSPFQKKKKKRFWHGNGIEGRLEDHNT